MIVFNSIAEAVKRETFLREKLEASRGTTHVIRPSSLYDMIHLYEDPTILSEYPFRIKFEGEKGLDAGGLSRDLAFGKKHTFIIPIVHQS